jgi:hypothetical protein
MRSGGFPCRHDGCDRAFSVTEQNSMEALTKASAMRTAHEIDAHGYHHVVLAEERPFLPSARIKQPRIETR